MKKFVTPPLPVNYESFLKAKGFGEAEPAYSGIFAVIKDSAFAAELKTAVDKCAMEKWGEVPKKLKSPLKDGDLSDDANFKGKYIFTLKNKTQPTVVNKDMQPIIDPAEMYSGAIVRCSFNLFAWQHPTGGKGVSFSLQNVMKVADGPRLGFKHSAPEDDFKDYINQTDDVLDD